MLHVFELQSRPVRAAPLPACNIYARGLLLPTKKLVAPFNVRV